MNVIGVMLTGGNLGAGRKEFFSLPLCSTQVPYIGDQTPNHGSHL